MTGSGADAASPALAVSPGACGRTRHSAPDGGSCRTATRTTRLTRLAAATVRTASRVRHALLIHPQRYPCVSPPPPQKLKAALAAMRAAAPHHIPLVINGEAVHTPPPHRVAHAIPHDTDAPPISSTSAATPALLVAAMDGARTAAASGWAAAPQAVRSAVFLKAAHLLGTDAWRWRVAAATVLAVGKTAFQAEIDAVAETADFWRFGAAAADDLARRGGGVGLPSEGGGLVQTPGGWNWSEARPLEGFVACMSPFKYVARRG